jgi:hypothetical protein
MKNADSRSLRKNAVAFVRYFKNIVFPLRKNEFVLSYRNWKNEITTVKSKEL